MNVYNIINMDNFYDVCVVGAGPAGSRIAYLLVRKGLRVVMLEKKEKPGVPVQCGEGVSHALVDKLNMPSDVIKKRIKGSVIITPEGYRILFPRKGYAIRRDIFDYILFLRAKESGVEVHIKEPFFDLKWRGGYWEVLSSHSIFNAKFVVGADGALSRVRRVLNVPMKSLFSMEYKFYNKSFNSDYFIFYNRAEYYPGYAWIFDRDDEISVGMGKVGEVKKELDTFVKIHGFDKFIKKDIIAGFLPSPENPPIISFKNGIFIGDAGGFVHPIVKGGIIGAIFSAEKGADLIIDAFKYGDDVIYDFPSRVKEHASRDVFHYYLLRLLPKMSNISLDYFGELLDNRYYKDFPFFKGLKLFIKKIFMKDSPLKVIKDIPVGILFQILYHRSENLAW